MVTCQICLKEYKRITRTHLLSHNLTTENYKMIYPNSDTIDQSLRHAYGKFFRENNPMKLIVNQEMMSKLHSGKLVSDSTRKKLSQSRQGKSNGPHSKNTKLKISLSNKERFRIKKENGYVRPEYKMSPEALVRASDRMIGNTLGKKGHHNKGMTLNLTIEQKRNRSKKRTEYLSKNKNIKSGTKPELLFIDFLTSRKIIFEHQCPVHTNQGSWLYDFYLPELDLFVEIDGEFWHSSKQSIRRDEIKNDIAKNLGKTLARITTENLDFSVIFLSSNEIWEKNISIINKRKGQ